MSDNLDKNEYYPLSQLPEGVSVSSSVLETTRTHADQKLREALNKSLGDLFVNSMNDKKDYGAQVSVEDDTSWVYIEETWTQSGLVFHRRANTNLFSSDVNLSLYVEDSSNPKTHINIDVTLDDSGDLQRLDIGGIADVKNQYTMPLFTDLLQIPKLEKFSERVREKMNGGFNQSFSYKWSSEGDELSEVMATNVDRAGNGFRVRRLKSNGVGDFFYGEALTKNLIFVKVNMLPLGNDRIIPPIERKIT